MELKIDPTRAEAHGATGVYVRARGVDDRWGAFDIAELTRESLITWLGSRGGFNPWAESTVLILMGHDGLNNDEIGQCECRDAKRYRFLRSVTTPSNSPFWGICPPAPATACVSGDQLDAAIDAELGT